MDLPIHSEVSIKTSSAQGLYFMFTNYGSKESRIRYESGIVPQVNEWIKIEVSLLPTANKYVITIRINDVVSEKITRNELLEIKLRENVSLHVAPATAMTATPADGEISNFELTTFALGTATCTEEAEKTVCNCTSGYELVRDGNVFTCKSKLL